MIIAGVVIFSILIAVTSIVFFRTETKIVTEDHVAITVNKNGFIKRVLPAGRHLLAPFERIELTLPLKTSLTRGWASAVTTSDGIPLKINWSGTYALRPEFITDNRSQRLRGLPNAENGIARSVDLGLRQMVGNYGMRDLFNPALRERMEHRLSRMLSEKLAPLGIGFNGINLQTIELPPDVAEAFSKAKAIETLDGTIRQLDPTTREVVRGAYRLDEILRWEQYFPMPVRKTGAVATVRS